MSLFYPSAQKSGSMLDLIRDAFRGTITGSGQSVNVMSAVRVSTIFAGCRVIGEGVAQVPLKLIRETGRTRTPAREHPLYNVLGARPNPWMTSFEYREVIIWHAVLAGNHYSFINRVRGVIKELIPFEPGSVTVKRANDWTLTYEVRADNGEVQVFPASAIWHVRGPSWNGWQGLDMVRQAREAIGLSLAIEAATASLHKSGASPSGVYSVEGTLNDTQYAALSAWIAKNIGGAENAGKVMLMDRAAKWTQMTMSGVDAQTMEQRRFQVEEVCRFMRVSPIMVYGSDKASTYAGSTANFLAHLTHTIAPWYQRLEQSMDANLLTDRERAEGYYTNFVEEGMLRTSATETKDILLGYVNGGIMTANEAREKLDMNPDADPESDELRIPANIVGSVPTDETTDPEVPEDEN